MQLLIATTNPAKIDRYTRYFKSIYSDLEIVTLVDLDPSHQTQEPVESGVDEAQNSLLKAKYYQKQFNFDGLIFAEDSGMTLIGVQDLDNPKKDIKKPVLEKYGEVSPENFVNYYSNLALKYGGRINQEWVFGYTLMKDETILTKILKSPSVLVSGVQKPLDVGYPLSSVTKVLKDGKEFYLSELDPQERAELWDKQVLEVLKELLTPFIK